MNLNERLPAEVAFYARMATEAAAYVPPPEEPNCLAGGGHHGAILWIEAGYVQPVCALCHHSVGLACIAVEA